MGFWGNLINGVKNVSSTVGKVAGALSGIPGIGAVASTVANVANMVNKGAGIAEGIYNAVAPAAKQIGGEIKGAIDAGKQAWDAGKQAVEQTGGAIQRANNNGGAGFSPTQPSIWQRALKTAKIDPAMQQRVQNSPYKMMFKR